MSNLQRQPAKHCRACHPMRHLCGAGCWNAYEMETEMSDLRKAAEQALAFLSRVRHWEEGQPDLHAIKVQLRAALAETEQSEPVINQCDGCRMGQEIRNGLHIDRNGTAQMTCQAHRYHPPRREPLSDTEIVNAFCEVPHQRQYISVFADGVRFAEKHYGITGEKT